MPGLVPAIHVFLAWGAKDVDARHKAGHDGDGVRSSEINGSDQRHSSGQASTIFQSSIPFLIFFMSVVSPPLRRIQSFTVSG